MRRSIGMERSLILLKPDAIENGVMGEIISRLENLGIRFLASKMLNVTQDLAMRHYSDHVGKPFFDGLVDFITSNPIMALVLEGNNVIDVVRTEMGSTNPEAATPGTIRADLAESIDRNLIHGSDSDSSAQKEIALFFLPEELVTYR